MQEILCEELSTNNGTGFKVKNFNQIFGLSNWYKNNWGVLSELQPAQTIKVKNLIMKTILLVKST